MDSESALPGTNNDPASAFESLRGEISLLRRAVEGLTAERHAAPNYKPTLAALAERLAAKIGRAHGQTPVTNAHLVCRILLDKKKYQASETLSSTQTTRIIADM